ncbi:hypothetical protein C2G38_2156088 [Gigaspora rosea]|uniref:Uncharacterized protein n=1 Tax=Gigaspora rosea TaxID=44941 RepID=A0A397W527_9GLOM|nr:hypothetical protein C2G38_2156088 [Gigaspora rosea]
MKFDSQNDMFEVVNNEGEAVDGVSQNMYIQNQHKNMRARMLSTSKLSNDKDLEKGGGRYK